MSDARQWSRSKQPAPGAGAPAALAQVRRDTIVAIATAPGRAAISVVRLSGDAAERIARAIIRPWPSTPRTMVRCRVHASRAPDAEQLDDALVVHFPAPHSYTGETVVEVHAHGGAAVSQAIAAAFLRAGARAAVAGEFSERAVLNGKLDLVRAEAIAELIDARTRAAHRQAMQGMSGVRTRAFEELRDAALSLEALVAFDIDFPEEDHGVLARAQVEDAASGLLNQLAVLIGRGALTAAARDGATVVLAGAPNAGKSSLLNALVGEARVIVSDEPGTTRDAVEVLLDGDPWPIRLVDTAGLRSDAGLVERLGMEVSERYLRRADVVLACGETVTDVEAIRRRLEQLTDAAVLPLLTKADLRAAAPTSGVIPVSAHSGEGLDALRDEIARAVAERLASSDSDLLVAGSARQQAALQQAHAEIAAFIREWREAALPSPVVGTHLRAATVGLEQLIGAVDVDDVLARVFSTFCVGK